MDATPQHPTQLLRSSWRSVLRRTVREFQRDSLTDWAAALTYYGVLSIFPGLLVLVSVVGLIGDRATDDVRGTLREVVPQGQTRALLDGAIRQVRDSGGTAGVVAILGLIGAFWSASGYVAAFMRASNTIYDVPEGRPVWKTLPIRIAVTAVIGAMLLASALIVVFTGQLAEEAGDLIGLGSTALAVWNVAKWPVLLLLVSVMLGVLYWASPNVRHRGFRWVSPGGVFAVLLWVVVSVLFAVYVANFAAYNKTYGTLAGVIIFLIWLWLTNVALLLGLELDAELERGRAMGAGHPPDEEPYVQLRDDSKVDERGQGAGGEGFS